MKRISLLLPFLVLLALTARAQDLTQTVRGTILDVDNELPLIGASVIVAGSNPLIGATTDINGQFRLENIPVGRISLQVAYIGYENMTLPNIVVNSGKEVVLNLAMQESVVQMKEAEIKATKTKGEAINDMALISVLSVSAEETSRYAGTFNDPSRVLSNFAGVTATQDGSNDIIVRGNSPKYIQWRLEGVQISNPNHFGDQNGVSGGISTLNNNLLANSDFYTGAFSPEYGDVLSGVYDVKLRSGNNEKFESIFGFGLLGTDITLEGPLKKGYGGSYLVNYRYSTAQIIDALGLIDVGGVPKFQDATFKLVLPTKNYGSFSVFGLAGLSSLFFEDITPDIWDTPGDRSLRAETSEDFDKGAFLVNTGLNHTLPVTKNSFLKTTLAFSTDGISDDIYEKTLFSEYDDNGVFIGDSVTNRVVNFQSRLRKSTYRAASTYHYKLNAKHRFQVGTKYALFDYDYAQSHLLDDLETRFTTIDFREQVGTLRNFVSWKFRPTETVTIVSGVHNMNVLFNNKSTVEPRVALRWQASPTLAVNAGYGSHSNMESIHNYFSRVEQPNGQVIEPNRDLDLLKAHHYVVGVERRFGKNLRVKAEAYYQDLYNLPVENNDTSHYATINEGLDFRYLDLVNEGTGTNYGVELTVERFFADNYYFLVNGTVYDSKYTAKDGVERNTAFNSNYLFNLLCGKDWDQLGKKKNRTLSLNAKVFYGGGRKIIPLLRDANGNLAVDPENGQFYDFSRAYEADLETIYNVILSASYKFNRPKATHEIFMNLDNVTNNKGKISEFYDETEPGKIGYVSQFGFFPNLMYRVYF